MTERSKALCYFQALLTGEPQAPHFFAALAVRAGNLGFTLNGFTVKGAPYSALACELVDEIVRTFGEVRLRVFGTSMVPSILPGDLITIERASLSEISAGEIVLFSRQGRLFAHRVVAVADDASAGPSSYEPSLVTRGDRLGHNDPPVPSSELLGRVSSVQRGDGRGDKQMQPAACLSRWERAIVRFLRHSDQATYLYVRLVKLRLVGARFTESTSRLRVHFLRERHAVPLQDGDTNDCEQSAGGAECRV